MSASKSLEMGDRFPFDASDDWWSSGGDTPPPPEDWAHRAARGVLADLSDRRGIRQGLENLDEDIRHEIVESLTEIIRTAHVLEHGRNDLQ